MDEKTFKERTKQFSIDIIQMTEKLPDNRANDILARQVIRSATSMGANYHAACKAKSPPNIINNLKIVEEEAVETEYWLEILQEISPQTQIPDLTKEVNELIAIAVTSIETLQLKNNPKS